jgi:hypothetical protein
MRARLPTSRPQMPLLTYGQLTPAPRTQATVAKRTHPQGKRIHWPKNLGPAMDVKCRIVSAQASAGSVNQPGSTIPVISEPAEGDLPFVLLIFRLVVSRDRVGGWPACRGAGCSRAIGKWGQACGVVGRQVGRKRR